MISLWIFNETHWHHLAGAFFAMYFVARFLRPASNARSCAVVLVGFVLILVEVYQAMQIFYRTDTILDLMFGALGICLAWRAVGREGIR